MTIVEKTTDYPIAYHFCFGWDDTKPFVEFLPQSTKQTGCLLDTFAFEKIQQQDSEIYVSIPYRLHGQTQIFNAGAKIKAVKKEGENR